MIGTAHMAAALYAAHAGGKPDVPFDALPQEDWSRWCVVARTAREYVAHHVVHNVAPGCLYGERADG